VPTTAREAKKRPRVAPECSRQNQSPHQKTTERRRVGPRREGAGEEEKRAKEEAKERAKGGAREMPKEANAVYFSCGEAIQDCFVT
jgi:hypothetical protein